MVFMPLPLIFTSCSNDDGDTSTTNNSLVGTWKLSDYKITRIVNIPSKLIELSRTVGPDSVLYLIDHPSAVTIDYPAKEGYGDDPECNYFPYEHSGLEKYEREYFFYNDGRVIMANPYNNETFYYQQKASKVYLYYENSDIANDSYFTFMDLVNGELHGTNIQVIGNVVGQEVNGVTVWSSEFDYIVIISEVFKNQNDMSDK